MVRDIVLVYLYTMSVNFAIRKGKKANKPGHGQGEKNVEGRCRVGGREKVRRGKVDREGEEQKSDLRTCPATLKILPQATAA